jgi:hypothetical protein
MVAPVEEGRGGMNPEIAAMDPLLSSPCLLCGERFEAEGYSERFEPELLPGMPVDGFAPAILTEGKPVDFVCPACFGDGGEDLSRSMRHGARRLRALARSLERVGTA